MALDIGLSYNSARQRLSEIVGDEIEDVDEETFLVFSQGSSEHDLGFVDGTALSVDVSVGSQDFSIVQSPGLLRSNAATGTTGAVLWKVTPLVAAWLADKGNLFWEHSILTEKATILELGCGVSGLIGLAMAPFISRYVLTDQAYVMKVLRQNISANNKATSSSRNLPRKTFDGVIQTLVLDWETDSASNVRTVLDDPQEGIALIVACDCIYNDFLIRPFVQICRDVCSLRPTTQIPTVVLISQQLRSDGVFAEWLHMFSTYFHVWRVPDRCLPSEMDGKSGFVGHIAIVKEDQRT